MLLLARIQARLGRPDEAAATLTEWEARSTDGPDEELRGSYGAAYTRGLGWDFFPRDCGQSGGWALTPLVLVRAVPGDPLTAFSGMLGMEVTWWSGLPKNQQEIPLERAFERE